MKSLSCNQVSRSLWRYIDRELVANDVSAISVHLRGCDRCQALYHERSREASQYRMTFVESPFGEHFVSKLSQRMKQEELGSGMIRDGSLQVSDLREDGPWSADASPGDASPGLSEDSVFTRRRFRRAATVAAMLLLIPTVVIIGIVFNPPRSKLLGTFEVEDGLVTESRLGSDGKRISQTVEDGVLTPGRILTVPQDVVARLTLHSRVPGENTTISLFGPAELSLSKGAAPEVFSAVLESGVLEANVAPCREGEIFEIVTANALATVVGTRFELRFLDGFTRLAVWSGTVRFQARTGAETAAVPVTRESGSFRVGKDSVVPECDPPLPVPSLAEQPYEPVDVEERFETSGSGPEDPTGTSNGEAPVPSSAPDLDTPFSPSEAER